MKDMIERERERERRVFGCVCWGAPAGPVPGWKEDEAVKDRTRRGRTPWPWPGLAWPGIA